MTSSIHTPVSWRLDAQQAEFQLAEWRGVVDLLRPELGIAVSPLSAQSRAPVTRVLGVAIGPFDRQLAPPAEVYVRDADLVALYPETDDLPFTLQVYWSLARRELEGQPSLAMDLTVSLQTQQLDVRGRVASESRVATSATRYGRLVAGVVETTAGAGRASLAPTKNPPWIIAELLAATTGDPGGTGYFETAAPSDYLGVELTLGVDTLRIRRQLLDEVMEKGVIRRLRCRGILVRGSLDLAAAERLDREFAALQPRLTT